MDKAGIYVNGQDWNSLKPEIKSIAGAYFLTLIGDIVVQSELGSIGTPQDRVMELLGLSASREGD